MKKFILLLVFLGLLLSVVGASMMPQEIIPLSSRLYQDMDALYLVTGNGTPSNARPWSKNEASHILSRIDRASLTKTSAAFYDSIAQTISEGLRFQFDDGFQFGVRAELNFEGYYHTNGTDFNLETDWIRGFEERKHPIRFVFDFGLKDFLFLFCDLQYGQNRFNYQDTYNSFSVLAPTGIGAIIPSSYADGVFVTHSFNYSKTFHTNSLPFNQSYDVDFQVPKRAVAAVGGDNWNATLSRDRISWGNGKSGNFIVDNHVDYHEFARVVAFTDYFKYDWLNIFFETNPSTGENLDDHFRIFMAHRLEFRIFDRITFALSENIMYQNNVFDIRYLNPAFIYHNLNNRSMFNAIAHLELDVAFGNGFNAYAQYVMDQARAPNESAAQADAMGFLGGLEYATVLGPGILNSSLEYALTNPLLYRRDGVDFLMYRKYFTHGNPAGPGYIVHLDYIGYPHGGDAQVLQWDVGYRIPSVGELNLRVMGMRHGEMNFFISHNIHGDNTGNANYEGFTPSGDRVEETLVVSFSGEYRIPKKLFSWVEANLWAQLDWIGKRTFVKADSSYEDATSDLQLTMGFAVKI